MFSLLIFVGCLLYTEMSSSMNTCSIIHLPHMIFSCNLAMIYNMKDYAPQLLILCN